MNKGYQVIPIPLPWGGGSGGKRLWLTQRLKGVQDMRRQVKVMLGGLGGRHKFQIKVTVPLPMNRRGGGVQMALEGRLGHRNTIQDKVLLLWGRKFFIPRHVSLPIHEWWGGGGGQMRGISKVCNLQVGVFSHMREIFLGTPPLGGVVATCVGNGKCCEEPPTIGGNDGHR
jgi:hypothetical protein